MRSYDQRSKIWSWTSWQSSQSNVSLTCNANWQGCNKNLLRAMVIHLLHSLPTHSSRRLRQERRFKPDFERIFHPNTRRYSTMNRIPKAKERGEKKALNYPSNLSEEWRKNTMGIESLWHDWLQLPLIDLLTYQRGGSLTPPSTSLKPPVDFQTSRDTNDN